MTVQRLDIPASQWRQADITAVRNVLTNVGDDPARVLAWRGSVVLSFIDVPDGYPYLNPEIAAFLQKLYSEVPHVLYFLNPERASGALDSFYASIGALCETEHGVWVMWSDDVAAAFYQALAAAAEFAIHRGDDWVAVVEGYEYDEIQTRNSEIRAILIARGVIPA
ncbi:hypothetical protein [Mycobacterium sp. E796]|uniref:hypothetical protein n=1 Tax=Mycobacterium sp. E796 TaxID=1834151 RepID=UPI0007FFA51D|nr:hypothetical protein [Mycobacterium sp. E796]OBI46178.1 hypothetical protein A5706_30335 [Mycobacterium sp. E796]